MYRNTQQMETISGQFYDHVRFIRVSKSTMALSGQCRKTGAYMDVYNTEIPESAAEISVGVVTHQERGVL